MNFEHTKNLIGRILISAIFIYAIPGKIIDFQRTKDFVFLRTQLRRLKYFQCKILNFSRFL